MFRHNKYAHSEVNLLYSTKTNHLYYWELTKGANPIEYVLAALNGCLTTSLIYHAAAQGVKIDEVESTLSGDLDLQGFLGMSEKVRNGYEKFISKSSQMHQGRK